MSDFQDALGELVERQTPDTVAPFSVLQQRRVRRARRRAVVVSCAAVVALAFGAAAIAGVVDRDEAGPATSDPAYRVDGPAPQRITVDGLEMELEGATNFGSVRLSSSGPNSLTAEAGANPPLATTCRPWTTMRVVQQGTTTVRIGAFEYRAVNRPRNQLCDLVGYGPSVFELWLGAALGSRRVVDAKSGDQVSVLDPGTTLAATYLPAGYLPGSLFVNGPQGQAPGLLGWTHAGPPGSSLEIIQGKPTTEPSLTSWEGTYMEQILARPTVRGHESKVYRSGSFTDFTCLKWRESEDLTVSVCSHGTPARLGVDELIKIADGLRRANDQPTPQASVTPAPNRSVVSAPSREPQGQYGGDTSDHLEVVVTGQYKNVENTVMDIYVDVLEQGSRVLSYDVDFGDGTTTSGSPTTTCPKPQERYTERYTFRHSYPDGFRSTVTIRVRTGDCETAGETTVQTFDVIGGVRRGSAT